MPYLDRTGPYGTGPVGFLRGRCRPTAVELGQLPRRGSRNERVLLNKQRENIQAWLQEIDDRLKSLSA